MKIEATAETIEYLWTILQQEPRTPNYFRAERLFKKYLKSGWIFTSDVEDLLLLLDSRLNFYEFRVPDLYSDLGVLLEEVHYRPRMMSNFSPAFCAMRPEYFVQLLIDLERMGFRTEAHRFVKLILPTIIVDSKTFFSSAELYIFWYQKRRHKDNDVIFYTDEIKYHELPDKKFKTREGFKVSVWADNDKQCWQILKIRAPKYREKRHLQLVTCMECGFEWQKGDPESSLEHRKAHKICMTYMKPKPLLRMKAALLSQGSEAEHVTWKSAKWKQKEMYLRARAFRREFRYDIVQWGENGEDENANGFLFTGDDGAIVGACAFRSREFENKQRWGLQWIWFAPDERRKGHLEKRWQFLRKRFGDFQVEHPVSEAMIAFLEKKGDTHLLK